MGNQSGALGIVEKREFRLPRYRSMRGAIIEDLRVGYETYGTLSPSRDNVVLVCHYFSGTSHAAGRYRADDPAPGWWDAIIGPGKAIDTDRYCVICSDTPVNLQVNLPTTFTTGPASINPATGRRYGLDFPLLSAEDFVHVQKALLEHLGVEKLIAVAGPSAGAVQAALWAVCYPQWVPRTILAVSPGVDLSPYSLASLRMWIEPILNDPDWKAGDYYDGAPPRRGLLNALKLIAVTALHFDGVREAFGRDWADPSQDPGAVLGHAYRVEDFLQQEAQARAVGVDANHLLYMVKALQQYDLRGRLDDYRARTLLLPAKTDLIFPPALSHAFAGMLRARGLSAEVVEILGSGGHLDGLGRIDQAEQTIRAFLEA